MRFIGVLGCFLLFFACGGGGRSVDCLMADSLNRQAYDMRYKNLELSEQLAEEALALSGASHSSKAEALNNLGFCAFIRMDFERADSLFRQVYDETGNELECLVADVGMMKICQRTSMNEEFYDYRNRALKRMKLIDEDGEVLEDSRLRYRYNYACSEFYITSAVYYYYLQQETQSMEAINAISVETLKNDTSQWLYYDYMRGSGGMYEAPTWEEVLVGEFDYLLECLTISHKQDYVYFEANASQAMAEMLKSEENYRTLLEHRPGMMRVINQKDLPWEELVMAFSSNALTLFKQYGDWYQIAGSYRTMASCLNEQGRHEEALENLTEALSYVNLHHEKYYHCHDTIDRLKPFVPMATTSTELEWINKDGIRTVPEWIARFREQLSVTYATLGMKPESDYNRNIYLDLLDYTRQDKELENRYLTLEKESKQLNVLLSLVIVCFVAVVGLLWLLNYYWRKRNNLYIGKLKNTLDVCQKIIASVPSGAEDVSDVTEGVLDILKREMRMLDNLSGMEIALEGEEKEMLEGACAEFPLYGSVGERLGVWRVYSGIRMKKDDRSLLKVIAPYIAWTLENGMTLVSLGGERKRLDSERYVHEQHLIENKRQNLVKKACLFLVAGITPFIDRVVNEVHKLVANDYLSDPIIKKGKYQYISELAGRINEYNDILASWIKMRQGSLNLTIENFELNPLFEVLQKSRKNYEQKGLAYSVEPTTAVVKADKALTLFMINTLAENARKYTPTGGEVRIYACESDDYVEISVTDNGPGLSEEDVCRILEEKVYDSGKIGISTAEDAEELRKNKGWGFGLMNCKGIIEKYRKTNALFKVCCFEIESTLGKGSRFYFRLPKGVNRMLMAIGVLLTIGLGACGEADESEMQVNPTETELLMEDVLLDEADRCANEVYHANLAGDYSKAIVYADSALTFLNEFYLKYSDRKAPLLKMVDKGEAAEMEWFAQGFDTDYYVLLDVRNEAAVAHLALGNLEEYRYNNGAYTTLYKQISEDTSLERYCVQMQMSASHKTVAIILCFLLLLFFVVGYYMVYFRHLITYRYNLEQVLEVNRKVFAAPIASAEGESEVATMLVECLSEGMNELLQVDEVGIAVYKEETGRMSYAFSGEENPEMKDAMDTCFQSGEISWESGRKLKAFPLFVDAGAERTCMGVLAVKCVSENEDDSRLMMELISNYIAVVVYNAVELVAQKQHDIELAQDETRRILREEEILYVQNQVLDNCLSTIKHETVYYPNQIKRIADKLNEGIDGESEAKQVETMSELVGYYKEVFTLLAACASRQTGNVTFRRTPVRVKDLADYVRRYFVRATKRCTHRLDLKVEAGDWTVIGDEILLRYMLENLVDESVAYAEDGSVELNIYKEGSFVRFDFVDMRRQFSSQDLEQLFNPHLAEGMGSEPRSLVGVEYLLCKQIIREHDEFAGRRGCRMNAENRKEGGFVVWFTIPAR